MKGERREAPSPGGDGERGAGRWAGDGVNGVGRSITCHPQSPPGQGVGIETVWGQSSSRQNQLSAQGVTVQLLGSLLPEGQRKAFSFVAS